MCRWAHIICLLVSVSFVLAPLGNVHAHVTSDEHEHVNVHSGHAHSLASAHEHEHEHEHERDDGHRDLHDHEGSTTRVLDMQPDVSPRKADQFDLVQWLAVAFFVALVILQRVPIRLKLPPPRIRARPPSPYPHAWPLLRGPPRSI
jgi:hypothetical protein